MDRKIGTIFILAMLGVFLFTTSCYLLGPKKSADNYAVFTTDDWTFTEYIFPDQEQLRIFISQVNKFYNQQKDADFDGAFREYLSTKRLSRYGTAIKRVQLKEVPSMFNMPHEALLTFVANGEVIYGKETYDNIIAEFEKKSLQQTW